MKKEFDYASLIDFYKDFPKPGVMFADIFPLLRSKEVFSSLVKDLSALVSAPTILAPEARGFLFSSPLLLLEDSVVESVVPLRKKGKMPATEGDMHVVDIEKEYGSDQLFFRLSDILSGKRNEEDRTIDVAIFDDVLATGGTAEGLAKYLLETEFSIPDGYKLRLKEFVFLSEIESLGGRERLSSIAPVKSLIML